MPPTDDNDEAQCDALEQAFATERSKWGESMSKLVERMRAVEGLSEVQVLMLSYRAICTESIAKYRDVLNRRKSKDSVFKQIRTGHYRTKTDQKHGEREIAEIVGSEMSMRNRKSSLLQTQIDYFADVMDTLDKLGYAIRDRIEIEKLRMA